LRRYSFTTFYRTGDVNALKNGCRFVVLFLLDKGWEREQLPENGEKNRVFGVYRALCCDLEIVITEGTRFPNCPNHAKLHTKWKLVPENRDDTLHPELSSSQIKQTLAA
jgi:hypothetical protein